MRNPDSQDSGAASNGGAGDGMDGGDRPREGARVIVNGRTEARVREAAAKVEGAVEMLAEDLSQADAARRTIERFPRVHILVNNLGVYGPRPFEQITDEDWRSIIETNFMSGVRLARHYLPEMKRAGWGRILFLSSESAAQVLAGPTMSEGVGGFLEGLAQSRGVPLETIEREFLEKPRPSSLLKRFEAPEETAAMVAFLASPPASGTNGAAVRVEGGIVRSIL